MTGPRSRQTKRIAGVLALAALLAFAGCNGILSGDQQSNTTSNATVTPLDVPTDQPTASPGQQLVPGLTSEGVTNGAALMRAQSAFLESHSTVTRSNTTVTAANGTILYSIHQTIRRGQSSEAVALSANFTGSASGGQNVTELEGWATDEGSYIRRTYENGSVTYSESTGQITAGGVLGPTGLSTYLSAAEQGNASVVTRESNGSPQYLVSGELFASDLNTTYRLTIDEQGVTRDLLAIRPNPGEMGEEIRAHATLESTGNESLEAPAWLSEAKQQTQPPTTTMPTATDETTHLGTSESSTSAATEANENGNTTIDGLVETTTA